MTEDVKKDTAEDEIDPQQQAKQDLARKLTKWILVFALAYFVWYVFADRHTPMTDMARVRGYVVPIAPQVSGLITKMNVTGDERVAQGDVLFEIDSRDYEYALQQANANLELAGQELGANTAAGGGAKARLESAKADFVSKEANANRIFAIKDKGIVTQADVDRATGILEQARQNVVNAEEAYQQAKEVLGAEGEDNAKIQAALAQVATASINLERTQVRAPSDGGVSYARIDEGHFASAGTPIVTFISAEYAWIEAAYKENNIGNMKIGDKVDIILDVRPGEVFQGTIRSIGFGVSFDNNAPGALAAPQKPQGWMRDPQRFNVVISFDDIESLRGSLREGAQASAVTYTSGNWLLNFLAKIWVWISTYLSYIY